jgi:hypothetical protein
MGKSEMAIVLVREVGDRCGSSRFGDSPTLRTTVRVGRTVFTSDTFVRCLSHVVLMIGRVVVRRTGHQRNF